VPRIFDDHAQSMGNTPLVRLHRVAGQGVTVLAKVEGRNPTSSVKCRVGAALIWDAEARGVLGPGKAIVEPTSGNTGIALAYVAAARGYDLTLVMPENMSIERRKVLALLGAHLMLTPEKEGMAGAVRRAEELAAEDPERFFLPQQFRNPANPAIHEATTGPEIWRDTGGAVDVLVAGVGTGGTLTGISRHIKKTQGKAIISVAVEPEGSAVISRHRAGLPGDPGPHGIQGIGAGFLPETLDLSLVDRAETVSLEEALRFARALAREEGILAGISSGAAVAVAARLAAREEFREKVFVVILPDSGERYLSTPLFDGLEI